MSEEPLYNAELVMKVNSKIKELFMDLEDSLLWRHLLRDRRDELKRKYNLK